MDVVIPMAGHSRRFKEVGYDLPKFLLDCGDKKMIEHVLDMFSESDNFHFILNNVFEEDTFLQEFISKLSPNTSFYYIDAHDLGPTFSIMQADLNIEDTSEIIISYCDFTVSWDYELFKRQVLGFDAGAPYFTGFQAASLGNTKYAYMQHDNFQMLELKEKESFTEDRLSEPASTGIYYFKSMAYFKILADQLFASDKKFPNNESYASLLLNEVIEFNGRVLLFKVNQFICLGTPEDYDQFNYWHSYFANNSQTNNTIFSEVSMIPMAGEGTRFKKYGYRTSKPSIQIGEDSLIKKCILSLPKSNNSIYLLRKNDYFNKAFTDDLKNIDPTKKTEFILVDKTTSGQAATCVLASDSLDKNESLMISSCDYELVYDSKKLDNLRNTFDPDVIIFTFKLNSLPVGAYENFAYCESNEETVSKIIEKKCISQTPHLDPMITGTFWYKSADLFLNSANQLIQDDIRINNEHYVGTSINFLISAGYKVMSFEVDQWISFGDPTELNLYYFWEEFFILND